MSEEAEYDVGILDGALEGVVGGGEEVQEPGDGEIGSEEEEPAGLGEVMEEGAGVNVGRGAAGLDGGGGTEELLVVEAEVDEQEEVANGHGGDAEDEAQRMT